MVQVNGFPAQHPDRIYTKHDWRDASLYHCDGDVGNLCQEERIWAAPIIKLPVFFNASGAMVEARQKQQPPFIFYTHAVVA